MDRMEPRGLIQSTENPNQGYSMMEQNPGYDTTPEARIAMAPSFGEAFRIARRTMGKGGVFEWKGKKYTTELAEEKEVKLHKEVATTLVKEKIQNQGIVHEQRKGEFDIFQTFGMSPNLREGNLEPSAAVQVNSQYEPSVAQSNDAGSKLLNMLRGGFMSAFGVAQPEVAAMPQLSQGARFFQGEGGVGAESMGSSFPNYTRSATRVVR